MIRAGQLRNRLSLQVPIRSRTAQGGVQVDWAELREVYAAIQQTYDTDLPHNAFRVRNTTLEKEIASKTSVYQTYRITMRAQSEFLKPDMRLVNTIYKQNLPYYQVFNLTESLPLMGIRNEMTIAAKETPCDNDSAVAIYDVLLNDDGVGTLNDDGDYSAVLA